MNTCRSAENFLRRWFAKEFVSGQCNPPNQSRQVNFGPQLGIVTFEVPAAQVLPTADLDSGTLQFPARFLMLASVNAQLAHATPPLLIHFQPLGHTYDAGGVFGVNGANGREPWFLVTGLPGTQDANLGWSLRVGPGKEFTRFYLDGLIANGALPAVISFIYSNDIDFMTMSVVNT